MHRVADLTRGEGHELLGVDAEVTDPVGPLQDRDQGMSRELGFLLQVGDDVGQHLRRLHHLGIVLQHAIRVDACAREVHVHPRCDQGEGIDPLHGLQPIDGTIDQLRRLEMHPVAGLLVDAGPKLAEIVA